MAAPSKFTPARQRAILDGLRVGMTRTAAVSRAEITLQTLGEWIEDNLEFSLAVTRAEAEAEARFTSVMEKAAQPHEVVETTTTTNDKGEVVTKEVIRSEFDWKAAESWLKRRRRADWGDNVAIDVDREIAELLARLAPAGEAEVT